MEDDPFDSELALELLRQNGLDAQMQRVFKLPAFEEALGDTSLSLILSDYSVPGVNPHEALRIARQKCPDVPFVFFTGTMGEDVAIESLKTGASDYVLKHQLERLVPSVKRALTEAEERTRRKLAEEALRQSEAQLRRANVELELRVAQRTAKLQEAIGELQHFSYTITHDMRAPLRSMRGYSALLLEGADKLTSTGRMYATRIAASAERMDKLITDALNYSKLVQQEIELSPVDVRKLLEDIIESYPNLEVYRPNILIASAMPTVLGNEAALTQCFSNLLSNAVKFVKPGAPPEIRIWAEPVSPPGVDEGESRETVRFWFEDNGVGIPKECLNKIFVMFERLSTKHEGTGIGLALVKKAAERMGGRVGVESQVGGGSRFWLEFTKA